jgi:hypothetical protein
MSQGAEQDGAEAAHMNRWHLVEPLALDSADGRHRLHRFVGRWGGGEVGEWAVLTRTQTGEALLDMARVRTGSAGWREDGALIVRIGGVGDARLIIIDPGMETFRDIGVEGASRPVEQLQSALDAAARAVGADGGLPERSNDYLDRDFSPDGRIMVEYLVQPQRMSHETRTPQLTDTATGEVLLKLADTMFDGSVQWQGPWRALMSLRHYTKDVSLWVEIDCERRTWSLPQLKSGDLPLETISTELPRRFNSAAAAAPAGAPSQAPRSRGVGAVIMASLLLLAAIGFGSWAFTEPARQKLTPMPIMPTMPAARH